MYRLIFLLLVLTTAPPVLAVPRKVKFNSDAARKVGGAALNVAGQVGGAAAGVAGHAAGAINEKAKEMSSDPHAACWIGSYGRGVGVIPKDCGPGKMNDAGLCYPKCPSWAPKSVGPVCWSRFGVIPVRTFPRGVGTVPKGCAPHHHMDAGLCYKACKHGYHGIGPVCWQRDCPRVLPHKCGAICTKSRASCAKVAGGLVTEGVTGVVQAGANTAQSRSFNPTGLIQGAFDMVGRMTKWKKCEGIMHLPANAFDEQPDTGGQQPVQQPMQQPMQGGWQQQPMQGGWQQQPMQGGGQQTMQGDGQQTMQGDGQQTMQQGGGDPGMQQGGGDPGMQGGGGDPGMQQGGGDQTAPQGGDY